MTRIAILRPEPGGSITLERARELGLDAFCLPLFEIAPLPWEVPDPGEFDAILLTSANAVRHGGAGIKNLTGLPAYCVGQETAEAAREAGFTVAGTGGGGINELLDTLPPDLRLLHPRAREHARINWSAQKITPATVYESRARAKVPELDQFLGAVVLLHSQRAGVRLAALVDEAGLDRATIAIAAISPAVARAAGKGWKVARYAMEPNDPALLALAAELCDKIASE